MKPEARGDLTTSRDCPVCGGRRKVRLHQQRFEANTGCAPFDGYEVVTCEDCGCGFADGIPAQSALDEYYAGMSKYENPERGGQESPWNRGRFERTAEFIAACVPTRDLPVLDVGCATGGLLRALMTQGFSDVCGLDPSPACAVVAQEEHGIRVEPGAIWDLAGRETRYGLVCVAHVLEHIRDLSAALAALGVVVAEGGYLFVEVPNVGGFPDCFDGPFQQFSIEHVNFFSEVSLGNLLRRAGFAPVRLDCVEHPIHARGKLPAVRCVARKSDKEQSAPGRDSLTRTALSQYLALSNRVDEQLRAKIESIVLSGEPIVVWGAGTHTLRLLKSSRLAEAKIVAFVDSNPHLQGKSLCGVEILAPSALVGRSEAVMVSSWGYQEEIAATIRDELGCANEIIRLYESEVVEEGREATR